MGHDFPWPGTCAYTNPGVTCGDCAPTLAATGSEMNCGAVITNEETSEKSFVQTGCLYPYAAVVDSELTLTVPKDQTAYGVGHNVTMEY